MNMNLLKQFLILLSIVLISGCATVEVGVDQPTLFYPMPPDEPRIQYLTSISSSKDITGGGDRFAKFVLGEDTAKSIIKPYGVTLDDGKMYVADTVNNSIEIIDFNKKTFEYFQPRGGSQLMSPINVAIGPDKEMYIADARRGQVLIFSSAGEYQTAIGRKGEFKPTDVVVWKDRLFICDLKTHSIRVHNLSDKEFRYSIPAEGQDEGEGKLFSPTNLDIDSQGHIYVTDTGDFRVKKYNSDGRYLSMFGVQGDTPGAFARPKGVAVDREKRIYVADAAFENVQVFDEEGKLLLYFPEQGDEVKLVLPAGVTIDYEHVDYFRKYIDDEFKVDYLIFVASQYGDKKINIFGFGKKK